MYIFSGNKRYRLVFVVAGTLSLVVGAIGLLVPVMPTSPFILVAAYCYARSSEKLYNWLHTNRLFGRYLRQYREGKGLSIWFKILSLLMLWISITVSGVFIVPRGKWWMYGILLIVGLGLTYNVLRVKTNKDK